MSEKQWDTFRTNIENNLHILDSVEHSNIHEKAQALTKLFDTAKLTALPKTTIAKKKHKEWWSKELTKMKRELDRLRKKIKRNKEIKELKEKTAADIMERKKLQKEFSKTIQQNKRNGWRKFVSDFKNLHDLDKVKFILKPKGHSIPQTLKKPITDKQQSKGKEEYTEGPKETLELLLNTHFPDEENNNFDFDDFLENKMPEKEWEGIEDFITDSVIQAAVNSFRPFKSPGPDGAYPKMIKEALPSIMEFTKNLFKESIKTGIIPAEWKQTKVVFIEKPNKEDYTDPNNLRPISLSSFFLKSLEKIILWYMQKNCLNTIWHENNYAYRQGKSIDSAIHKSITYIEKNIGIPKGHVIGAFLDLNAAFNNVTFESMIKSLAKTECDIQLLKWTWSMLNDRKATTTTQSNTTKVQKTVTRGIAQGATLSPILFNLLMEDLLKQFVNEPGLKLYIFADDIFIMQCGKDITTTRYIMQKALKKIEEWAISHKLSFTAKKCKAIIFSKNRKLKDPKKLTIKGQSIEWVKNHKYLGLTIDKHLDWNQHLEDVQNKCIKNLFELKKAIGHNYGPAPKVIKLIYEQVILPTMGHACIAWYNKLDSQKSSKIFNRISKIICSYICCTFKSMNTRTIETILGLQPIKNYIQEKALNTAARLKANGDWTDTEGHTLNMHSITINKQLHENQIHINKPRDEMKQNIIIEPNFKTSIINKELWLNTVLLEVTPSNQSTINIYTDS